MNLSLTEEGCTGNIDPRSWQLDQAQQYLSQKQPRASTPQYSSSKLANQVGRQIIVDMSIATQALNFPAFENKKNTWLMTWQQSEWQIPTK